MIDNSEIDKVLSLMCSQTRCYLQIRYGWWRRIRVRNLWNEKKKEMWCQYMKNCHLWLVKSG